MFSFLLHQLQIHPQSLKELKEASGLKKVSGSLNRILTKLQSYQLIEQTIPEKPNHPGQKLRITERGIIFIQLVESYKN